MIIGFCDYWRNFLNTQAENYYESMNGTRLRECISGDAPLGIRHRYSWIIIYTFIFPLLFIMNIIFVLELKSVNFRMNLWGHRFSQNANQKLLPYPLINFQGRNPSNFLLALWEKRWPYEFHSEFNWPLIPRQICSN